jgi:glycosyltransferase involved in cell wall biosynthesis
MSANQQVAVVVIGRNEGERLKRCFASLQAQHAGPIIYVDSGSTDDSVAHARQIAVQVVELAMDQPFTMARARNAGLMYVSDHYPNCSLVQFVDGDCEVAEGWLAVASDYLAQHPQVVAVCGNRVERFPDATVYNQLIAMEWQALAGEVEACGGDAMYRTDPLLMVDGFNDHMIAGEEAELGRRLTATGLSIMRLDQPMTTHDANMQKLSQWWLRSIRCGHAYAQGYDLQRHNRVAGKSCYRRRQVFSSLFYGVAVPALLVLFSAMLATISLPATSLIFVYSAMLFLLSLYIRVIHKSAWAKMSLGNSVKQCFLYAYFVALAKFPEAQGILKYYKNKLFGKTAKIIEYRQS